MERLSPAELVKRMHSYGITVSCRLLSLCCLGPAEVSVREMVTAYSAFCKCRYAFRPYFCNRHFRCQRKCDYRFRSSPDRGHHTARILPHPVCASQCGRQRYRQSSASIAPTISPRRWAARSVRQTTMPTAGSWHSHPILSPAHGWAAMSAISHFNSMAQGQGRRWRFLYMENIRKVYDDPTLPYSQGSEI